MKKVAFAFAAVTMAGAMTHITTSPAFAANQSFESITIDTADYDLRTAQGYSLMTDRIDRASKQVCGVITVGNEVIMIDRAAFSESGANTYSFSWETYDGQVISLIGLRAEFQEFDLIA